MLAALDAAGNARAKAAVEALAPPPQPRSSRRSYMVAGPAGPPTLQSVSQTMMNAAMAMQQAEVAPTIRQIEACREARSQFREVMARWNAVKASISVR